MKHPGKKPADRAFSLVELLLVIAVLVVLAGLFLPAFQKARLVALTTSCKENLDHINTAMRIFVVDNNGYYPESGGRIPWNTVDPQSQKRGWMEQISPITGRTNVFFCPANQRLEPSMQGPFNYFNGCRAAYLKTGGYAAVHSIEINYTTAFVLGGDTAEKKGAQSDAPDADKDDATCNRVAGAADNPVALIKQVHLGGQNLMFADGHCGWFQCYREGEMTFAYECLANWSRRPIQ